MREQLLAHIPTSAAYRSVLYVLLVITVVGLTFSIALSSIAMGTAIGLWLFYLLAAGKGGFSRTPFDLFFVAYVAAEALSTIFAVEPLSSLVNMKRLLLISVFYLVLLAVDRESRFAWILGSLAAVTTLLTIAEVFSVTTAGGHFVRISFFQYYLTEAGIKMFVALMILPVVVHPSAPLRWRVAAGVSVALLLLGLVITQTRSAWLGFIAGAVTLAYRRNKKLLIVLALLIVAFFVFAPQDYRSRAESIVDPTMTSNLTRIHMITTGWRMFLDYPLVGTGDIDLKKLYVTYITPIDEAEGGHLHNNFMMLLVTLGIVGWTATMALFVKMFLVESSLVRSVGNHWLYESAVIGALAAYVGFHVNGLFEWNFGDHEIAVFLWFTLGMALTAERLSHREQSP